MILAFQRLITNRVVIICTTVLLFILSCSIFIPGLLHHPSPEFSPYIQQFKAIRTTLSIGIAGAMTASIFGLILGILVGSLEWNSPIRPVSSIKFFILMPQALALTLAVSAITVRTPQAIALLYGLTAWPWIAYLTAIQVSNIKNDSRYQMLYLNDHHWIHAIWAFVLPSLLPFLLSQIFMSIQMAIYMESFLSLLSLGPQTADRLSIGSYFYALTIQPIGIANLFQSTFNILSLLLCLVPLHIVQTELNRLHESSRNRP